MVDGSQSRNVFSGPVASLSTLANDLAVFLYVKDPQGRYQYVSRGVGALFGVSVDDIVGRCDADFFDLERSPDLVRLDHRVFTQRVTAQGIEELWIIREECSRAFFSIKVPLLDAEGCVTGLCGVSFDMTQQMQDTNHLVMQNKLLDTVLAHVDAFVFQKDAQGHYLYANKKVTDLYGRSVTEVLGRTDLDLLPREVAERLMANDRDVLASNQRWAAQEVVTGRDASVHYFWSIKVPLRLPGQPASLIGFASEITELLALQETLQREKTVDGLTGLHNRAAFEDALAQALDVGKRHGQTLAVLMLDVDHFKYINTTYGKTVGDRLLVQVAVRLDQLGSAQASVARFSGNRFSMLVQRVQDPQDIASLAAHWRQALAAPIEIDEHRFHVTVSIGVSLSSTDAQDAAGLLTAAEAALYRAKELGRDQFAFYSREIGESIAERAHMEHGLREALSRNEFELHYQPKVVVESGQVCGVEALVRWRRSDGTLVSPVLFIPLAEQLGIINELGRWIVEQACRQLHQWRAGALGTVSIAVNLSPYQLRDNSLPQLVAHSMQAHGIEAGRLEMEVTESLMMHNPDHAIAILEQLRFLGVGLAIDDFGTGFSSMSYLKRLPVDTLKLDKAFITQIAHDEREADLCAGLIALAHKMGLKVVAEGVEQTEQVALLQSMQCEIIQGYFYSRPLPLAQVETYIHQQNGLSAP